MLMLPACPIKCRGLESLPMRFSLLRRMLGQPRKSPSPLARTRLFRVESLEDRRLLSVTPVVDLNGAAPGLDFAVERANNNGLVAVVSHGLIVRDDMADLLISATVTIPNALPGDNVGVLTHATNITANYADGVLHLNGADTTAHYQQVLRTARFNSTESRDSGAQVDIQFVVNDGTADSAIAHSVVTVIDAGTGTVAGRHIFYNNSSFDGKDLAPNAADDLAIAADKQVLPFDQPASQANYTNYSRGLNGIMIDIASPHGTISVEDFIFQVGNNNFPDTWAETPAPSSVTTRPGAGQGGSDRVEIIWPDGAIANEWLEVVVAANHHTGLAKPDTFYFGNAIGESGNSTSEAHVTGLDALAVINRLLGANPAATLDDPIDLNRDQSITTLDALVVINQLISTPTDLQLINVEAIASNRINSTTSAGLITYRSIYLNTIGFVIQDVPLSLVIAPVTPPIVSVSTVSSSPSPPLDPLAVVAAFATPAESNSVSAKQSDKPEYDGEQNISDALNSLV